MCRRRLAAVPFPHRLPRTERVARPITPRDAGSVSVGDPSTTSPETLGALNEDQEWALNGPADPAPTTGGFE